MTDLREDDPDDSEDLTPTMRAARAGLAEHTSRPAEENIPIGARRWPDSLLAARDGECELTVMIDGVGLVRVSKAVACGPNWVRLTATNHAGHPPLINLPHSVDRGLEVPLNRILWIVRIPRGS